MTKVEYRKIVWGLLKDYRDDPYMNLEKLLELIMAIPFPEEKQKGKITFNRKKKMIDSIRDNRKSL